MVAILLACILGLSFYAVEAKDLLYGTIALSGVSLLSAMLFFILKAPDVAITEAAVGAGVSTVVYVWAIKATDRKAR